MTLPDINVWVALAVSTHSHHAAAVRWLETQDETAAVAFCRVTQQGFLRLLSSPKIIQGYGQPRLTNAQVWAVYESLMADSRIVFVAEPAGIETQWRDFGARDTASTKVWMDAYLAAFAVSGGLRLVTFDQDFRSYTAQRLDLQLLHA